jgi:hypothetical protein
VVALSLLIQVILVVAAAAADWRINDGKPLWASFSMYVALRPPGNPHGTPPGVGQGQGREVEVMVGFRAGLREWEELKGSSFSGKGLTWYVFGRIVA